MPTIDTPMPLGGQSVRHVAAALAYLVGRGATAQEIAASIVMTGIERPTVRAVLAACKKLGLPLPPDAEKG
jgi:hypothetical protein